MVNDKMITYETPEYIGEIRYDGGYWNWKVWVNVLENRPLLVDRLELSLEKAKRLIAEYFPNLEEKNPAPHVIFEKEYWKDPVQLLTGFTWFIVGGFFSSLFFLF